MGNLENQAIWAVPTSTLNREAILWCGNTLAEARNVQLKVLGNDLNIAQTILTQAKKQPSENTPGMILSDWPHDQHGQAWLHFALEHELAGVFLRWPKARAITRVIVPTSGGSQVIRQLWIAQAVAKRYRCPVQVLHVIRSSDPTSKASPDSAATRLLARGLGITTPIQVSLADDVISGLAANILPDDLIVLGAPNHWRLSDLFASSLPDLVAKAFSNPLMMLLGRKPTRIRLREVFWPQMITLQIDSVPRNQAIAQLVDVLVLNNQVPSFWRDRLIQQALLRETIVSTAVGSDTAFPHITMPIHGGLTGCLGIFPNGIDFGGENGPHTRFVFLMLTPQDCYGDYLDVLAKISRKLILPALRKRLLNCSNANEVLNVIDPDDEAAPGNV